MAKVATSSSLPSIVLVSAAPPQSVEYISVRFVTCRSAARALSCSRTNCRPKNESSPGPERMPRPPTAEAPSPLAHGSMVSPSPSVVSRPPTVRSPPVRACEDHLPGGMKDEEGTGPTTGGPMSGGVGELSGGVGRFVVLLDVGVSLGSVLVGELVVEVDVEVDLLGVPGVVVGREVDEVEVDEVDEVGRVRSTSPSTPRARWRMSASE